MWGCEPRDAGHDAAAVRAHSVQLLLNLGWGILDSGVLGFRVEGLFRV